MTRVAGPYNFDGPLWNQVTQEAFTVSIDPGGNPPPPGILIDSQANSDKYGPFDDIEALHAGFHFPNVLKHKITVEFTPGVHSVGSFGDLAHYVTEITTQGSFSPPVGGFVYAARDGLVRVSGTGTYAVTSSDAEGNVTLAADPGFAAEARRGDIMNVVSGNHAGARSIVRNHAAAAYTVTNRFSPALDGTDVVEFLERSSTLEMTAAVVEIKGEMTQQGYSLLTIDAIDVTSAQSFPSIQLSGPTVTLRNGARTISWWIAGGNLRLDDCIVVPGAFLDAITVQAGLVRVTTQGGYPLIYQGGTVGGTSAIRLAGPAGGDGGLGQGSSAFLIGGCCFDDFDNAAVTVADAGSRLHMFDTGSQYPRHNASAPVFARVENGGRVSVDDMSAIAAEGEAEGSSSSVSVDGIERSWSAVDTAQDKTVIGPVGSYVYEPRPTF